MKREFSAGGIVYRKLKVQNAKSKVEWLIAKSAATIDYPNSYWRLPKGWIDDREDGKKPGPVASGEQKARDEELKEAALREVREEGGVEASIVQKVGTETYVFTTNGGKV